MQKRLISVQEAAEYLGIKKSTLYTWAGQSRVPTVKIGRRLLFDLKELDRWIDAHKSEDGEAEDGYYEFGK